MDPNETLRQIILAATQKAQSPQHAAANADDLRAYAEDLATWLERGGFAPEDPRRGSLPDNALPLRR